MDKENVVYLTNDVITQLLKTRMPGNLKQMDGTRKKIILREVTPTNKDKHGMYSLISGYEL